MAAICIFFGAMETFLPGMFVALVLLSPVQIKSVTFLVAQKILITFLKKRVILMRDILRQILVKPIFFRNNISQ